MRTRRGTLFIRNNDLEADVLIARAQSEWRIVPSGCRPWGDARPTAAEIAELRAGLAPGEPVVLVEAPAPVLEAQLRGEGHPVTVIDHHLYILDGGSILDRRREASSLEQFAALFPPMRHVEQYEPGALSGDERLVAANDRGFWPALAAEALIQAASARSHPLELVRNIRHADLARIGAARGEAGDVAQVIARTAATIEAAVRETGSSASVAQTGMEVLHRGGDRPLHRELVFLRAPVQMRGVLLDALYELHVTGRVDVRRGMEPRADGVRDEGRLERLEEIAAHPLEVVAMFEGPGTGTGDARAPVQLSFSGPGHRSSLLDGFLRDCLRPGSGIEHLDYWAGGSAASCYLGAAARLADPCALDDLADRLIEVLRTPPPTDRGA